MSSQPRSTPLTVPGPAGPLEVLLEEPPAAPGDPPRAAFAVVCHPHPLHGGTLQNKVVYTLARTLQEFGLATLRFNFRGVGESAGVYDAGRGELEDTLAVIACGREHMPAATLTLAGFSFGAQMALLAAPLTAPVRLITVAPPVSRPEFKGARGPGCPWLIVQGDADEIVDHHQVAAFAARFTPPPTLRMLAGVNHLFHGRLTELHEAVAEFLKTEAR